MNMAVHTVANMVAEELLRGIPGCKAAARRVAELAVSIMEYDF